MHRCIAQEGVGPEGINKLGEKYGLWLIRFVNNVVRKTNYLKYCTF